MQSVPENFLDDLASTIYTKENINRANKYLNSRGIDEKTIKIPWTLTGDDVSLFAKYRNYYPPSIFIDTLFIPIPDIANTRSCEVFDCRYIGDKKHRTRFHKLKRNKETSIMIYGFQSILENPEYPLIVTEGAIDAESVNQLGLPVNVISPLTALFTERWIGTLIALSNKIYFLYDNDEQGLQAIKKVMSHVYNTPYTAYIKPILYNGKDPNDALLSFGINAFKSQLEMQIQL